MPEITLSVRIGLYAFIALMIGAIGLYHYLTARPRSAPSGGGPAAAARPPEPEPPDSRPRSRS